MSDALPEPDPVAKAVRKEMWPISSICVTVACIVMYFVGRAQLTDFDARQDQRLAKIEAKLDALANRPMQWQQQHVHNPKPLTREDQIADLTKFYREERLNAGTMHP